MSKAAFEATTRAGDPLRLGSPVTAMPGVNADTATRLERLGITTISELIRHLPSRYEEVTQTSSLAALPAEGSVISVKGELTSVRWQRGFGRRKGRFEAVLHDGSGRLDLVWFNGAYLIDKLHAGLTVTVRGKLKRYGGKPQLANPQWRIERPESDSETVSVAPPEPGADTDAADQAKTTPGTGPGTEAASPSNASDGLTEAASDPSADADTVRLRPVYPATDGLPSHRIERLIRRALRAANDQLEDPLPEALRRHHEMPPLREAYRMAHQPADPEEPRSARRRLAYNELLLLKLGVELKRAHLREHCFAPALAVTDAMDRHIRSAFPFPLTASQDRVIRQLREDIARPEPMNRLVQGDVGAGKTVVALYAMLAAVATGRQAAMVAPTELLAEQHYLSIGRMLEGGSVRVELLTASSGGFGVREAVAAGRADIVIGTHAVFGESVRFDDLGLVVIDEQHRFGVAQRAALRSGEEQRDGRRRVPHHLVMTATPIPRTLSLTLFGDLDVSTIDQLPPGRSPIITRVVGPEKRPDVYGYVRQRLERGEQAYVVVPAIGEDGDEASLFADPEAQPAPSRGPDASRQPRSPAPPAPEPDEGLTTLTGVLRSLTDPDRGPLRGLSVEAVHGRMDRGQREAVMSRFRRGDTQAMVATTVIEVGVDVANAQVMVIEEADRFGLAQLHQLRGRVGRGSDGAQALCVCIAEPTTESGRRRLEALAATTDGFRIAEEDFAIRGMGEFFGTRQAGSPPLRVASLPGDLDLLQLASRDARRMICDDPRLEDERHRLLRKVLTQQHGDRVRFIDVG